MMDWTDRHCRFFHRLLSPNARLYSEMVVAQAVIHGDRNKLLGFHASEHPVALQIGGSEPELLAQAARIGVDFGYDEINLNVGCPSDRVQSGRFGACLMREPSLVADCVAAMRAQVAIPVTVKCRLGVDELDSEQYFVEFVETVAQAGCQTFIVHARKAWLKGLSPRENREIPPLHYERVFALKQRHPELNIVLNGGLNLSSQVHEALTKVDGVMIGRAAYHTPAWLQQLEFELFGTDSLALERVLERMREYIDKNSSAAPNHVLKHMLGLFHGRQGARRFRQLLTGVKQWNGAIPLHAACAEVGIQLAP
jgi:tRNA-dihydrouridine synthase A